MLPTYGLTEASSQATTVRPGTLPDPANGSGPPLPGVDLRIGPTGTIQLRGRTLLSGHHPAGRHPAPLADGWLDTGDHGRIDGDGNLHVLGRRTDLIVSGGENVYPAEVEAALIAQPGVVAACVIGEDDDAWGQRVLAVIVAAPPFESGEALIQAVSASLAPFKRPRRVVLVDELPLNQTGKIDRAEVRRRVLPSD